MERQPPTSTTDEPSVLTRADVRTQIQTYSEGRISQSQLAAWAFNQFYAYDTDTLLLEDDAEDAILEALDTLMFADDPAFALDEPELQTLLTHLQS